jgi:T-complex protein 1 subunit theta
MDDIERAIEDGVNTFKAMVKDGRFLAGAGAAEIAVASKVSGVLVSLFEA